METATRTQTAFRLKDSLLEKLKWEARRGHLSLNAYVEAVLEESVAEVRKFPKVSQEFFQQNRSVAEDLVLKGVGLPKEYDGLDASDQVSLDKKLLEEVLYEDNL